MDEYIVYVLTDGEGRIISVNSSAFLTDTQGWTPIDSGATEKYRLAQRLYFPLPIIDEETGVLRYRLEGGAAAERTEAEMNADAAETAGRPSLGMRVSAVEESTRELGQALELLLSGVTQ